MKFWDTSAIVPLLIDEATSPATWRLAQEDALMIVWWGTLVQAASAISRREREGLDQRAADRARVALRQLSRDWDEIDPSESIRAQAGRLVRRHPLRAADALQLAAAMAWARGAPEGHAFVTLDARLAAAARGEGFDTPLPA